MTAKEFTVVEFTRKEINIYYRRVQMIKFVLEQRIKKLTDRPSPIKLTDKENKQLTEYRVELDQMTTMEKTTKDFIEQGLKNRIKLIALRDELEEALELVEEPEAKKQARHALANLPKEENYRLSFDRESLAYFIKMFEGDIQKMRNTVIPNYQKMNHSDFEDKIQTKTYYVNKAKKDKETLDALVDKLRKVIA